MGPFIIEKTDNGDVCLDIFSRLMKERIIFLMEDIDVEVATRIAATMFYLNNQNKTLPISFYMNSSGGDVNGLFLIFDMMQMVDCEIHTYCLAECSSAAAMLLASGTKGKRFALPNSQIMIHQIQISQENFQGTGTDVEQQAKTVKDLKVRLTELLARYTGQPYKKVLKDCEIDKYMSSAEALKYGIIDHILPPKKEVPELIKAKRKKTQQ